MFINIKLSKLFKIFFIITAIVMLLMFIISIYKVFSKSKVISGLNIYDNAEIVKLSSNNYTNALKAVHDNLDEYVGTRIHFTGFVYRIFDFTDTQFVLARNMIISSDNQAVVVGFLCDFDNAKDFQNDTWVEITGTITKGNYHGEIPVIKVNEINTVDCPTDEFVYPPDEGFVPTNAII